MNHRKIPDADGTLPLLVIEDEPSVQAFLRTALERDGFRIVLAASGTEGLRLLQQQKFQGIISDMRTPGGVNGGDVHSWLASNCPELVSKLLFITGDIVNEETTEILRRTGVPCIEKPFRVQELLSAVKQVLGS
ncbi:MAG TPA: response regulator [Terriglobales bacterium]|nr:response regulator [Terriglobales bacterium]